MSTILVKTPDGKIVRAVPAVSEAELRAALDRRLTVFVGCELARGVVAVEMDRGGGDWDARVFWKLAGTDAWQGSRVLNRKHGALAAGVRKLLAALSAPFAFPPPTAAERAP